MSLHSEMSAFLQTYLKFLRSDDADEEIEHFWRFFDVRDPFLLALMVEVNPWWDGANLVVRETLMYDPECLSKVSTVLAHCWHWATWSDTRWVRAGRRARFYLKSLATGIAGEVRLCMDHPRISKYHMQGHTRCTPGATAFFATCSVCSVPPERILVDILRDDRLLKRAEEMHGMLQETLHTITSLPDFLWKRLANIIGGDISFPTSSTGPLAPPRSPPVTFTGTSSGCS